MSDKDDDEGKTQTEGGDNKNISPPEPPASPAQSAEPVKPVQQVSEPKEPKPEDPFTRADAEAMVAKVKDEVTREARSYADRGRVRVEQAVKDTQASIKNMRGLGQEISDDKEETLISKARSNALVEPTSEQVLEDMTPEQRQDYEYSTQTLGRHDLIMQGKYGTELLPEDPEAKSLEITGDATKDLASVESAYKAKTERLNSESNSNNPDKGKLDEGLGVRSGSVKQGSPPSEYDPTKPPSYYLDQA